MPTFSSALRVALDKYEPAGNLEAWLASVGDTWIVGTVDEAASAAPSRSASAAGVDRVMLRLPVHRDLDMVRLIGKELAQ